jgi:hypothetical protein
MKIKIMFLMVTFFAFSFTDLKAVEVNDTIRKANDTVPTAVKAEKPVTLTPYHRNVIKFNPTPMLLMGNVRTAY